MDSIELKAFQIFKIEIFVDNIYMEAIQLTTIIIKEKI